MHTYDEAVRPIRRATERYLTLDHLWVFTLLALIWLFLSITPLPPNDLWWHMAAGRAMIQEGALITTNRWAYTLPADAPYVYQSWLSELIMYGVWWLGDVPLLTLTRTLVITLSYGLISWHAWRQVGQGKAVALALFLAVMVGWNNWTLRPQTLAFLPGVAFVVVLGEYRSGRLATRRLLLLLPLLMILWVNLHGSFMLGAALLALAWLGTAITVLRSVREPNHQAGVQLQGLTLAGGATLLALLVNPLGIGIFGYVQDMLTNTPLQQWFVEWQPPENTFNLAGTGFWFYALLLLLAVLMATGPRRPTATDLLWYCALAWLTIGGVRYAAWFALVLLPLLAERLALLLPNRPPARGSALFSTIYSASLGVMLIAVLPWFMPARYLGIEQLFADAGRYRFLVSSSTPIAATAWLADNPIEGRFWTTMTYSSYTIWEMPEKQVFADLRVELFPVAIWEDYFTIARGDERSLAVIDRWQITHLLLPVESDLHLLLANTPGWCEAYSDSQSAVLAQCR